LELRPERPLLSLYLPGTNPNATRVEEYVVSLARSSEFEYPCWQGTNGRDRRVIYYCGRQEYSAEVRGARVLFNRRYLAGTDIAALERGDVGPVRLELLLDVEPLTRRRAEFRPQPGTRILAVCLPKFTEVVEGVAGCAVFRLTAGGETGIPLAEPAGLWARPERSFVLPLLPREPLRRSPVRVAAERIVREACGFKYGERRGWLKRQTACQAILLPSPMSSERRSLERRLLAEVRRQAEIFGLAVRTVPQAGVVRVRTASDLLHAAHNLHRRYWARDAHP
jgi:hypothetical protein